MGCHASRAVEQTNQPRRNPNYSVNKPDHISKFRGTEDPAFNKARFLLQELPDTRRQPLGKPSNPHVLSNPQGMVVRRTPSEESEHGDLPAADLPARGDCFTAPKETFLNVDRSQEPLEAAKLPFVINGDREERHRPAKEHFRATPYMGGLDLTKRFSRTLQEFSLNQSFNSKSDSSSYGEGGLDSKQKESSSNMKVLRKSSFSSDGLVRNLNKQTSFKPLPEDVKQVKAENQGITKPSYDKSLLKDKKLFPRPSKLRHRKALCDGEETGKNRKRAGTFISQKQRETSRINQVRRTLKNL